MKISLTILFSISLFCCYSQNNDAEEIKKVFNNYKTAILTDKAEDALNTIDSRTKNYYSEILTTIKNGDSIKINSLSLTDKITVLGTRAKATKSEIRDMQGTDVFIFSIKNGMVGKNSVVNNTVGDITIDNTFAKGEILSGGKKTSVYFHFYKENDQWKLNLTDLFSLSNIAFTKMIEDSGYEENVFLIKILENLSGRKISSEIWNPIP